MRCFATLLRSLFLFLALSVCSVFALETSSELIVVANLSEGSKALDKNDLRNIFLGRGGTAFIPIVPPPDSKSRIVFNTQIIGLNESRIQSFYAQMQFSGRARPPAQLSTLDELVDFVTKTPNGITYLPKNTLIPENLRIVFRVNM